MTTKAGYYGSDDASNRFRDPKTNEAYFTLVNQQTGAIEIYNEEFGADKRVGTLNKDGTVDYNGNWWGGANQKDKDFVNSNLKNIRNKSAEMVKKTTSLSDAAVKELTGGNTSLKAESLTADNLGSKIAETQKSMRNIKDNDQTRNSFPGAGGKEPLVFPETIRSTQQDILKFNMVKYVPKDFSKDKFAWGERKEKRDIIGSVVLPIPIGISDSNAVSWGGDSMNALDTALAELALRGIEEGVGGLKAAAEGIAEKVGDNSAEAKTALANTLAGMASGNQGLLSRTTGAILNPNMELLFSGPSLRPFNFTFTLSPRSADEAKTVIKIIRFFKQGMAPIRSKSMLFLKSPHTFQLAYKYRGDDRSRNEVKLGRDHPFLNKFKECALQGFGVQYTPTGNYSTFSDGVMMQYQVSMQFQELEPIYNDDYGNGAFPTEVGF